MNFQTVTLNMPAPVYQRVQRAAEALRRPMEEIIVETLRVALPPLDDVPPDMVSELAAMSAWSDDDLWKTASGVMSAKQQNRLRKLSAAKQKRSLNLDETRELNELRQAYGQVTLRKAQAYALLRQRGLYSFASQ
jgi:hypothetical protein